MKKIGEAQGRVAFWLYTVSHGQLLLRRPKTDKQPTRIDILFKDVVEINLRSYFLDLRVEEDDVERNDGRAKYLLIGSNGTGWIVAGAVFWAEDSLEYDEPSSLMDK
jgi:hypothetical protein